MGVSFVAGSSEIHPTIIRCNCGHRVVRRDVIQTGLYLSVLGPSYVYVRYRCGRCKRMGEQLVEQEAWDPSVLQPAPRLRAEVDLARFRQMGEITPDEIIAFHYGVQTLGEDSEGQSGAA
jgi:hypothetical protein